MDELAKLVTEYKLTEATLEGEGFKMSLRKSAPKMMTVAAQQTMVSTSDESHVAHEVVPEAAPVQAGTPISSPMTGIYYTSPSPNAPPFVKEGESVTAGQVIGLIEAMKVFNEIVATTSGTVIKIAAESGQIVNPGDPLVYIGQ